jgi:hypothetical protein
MQRCASDDAGEAAGRRWLIMCVRAVLGTGRADHRPSSDTALVNWTAVERTAVEHGVLPLVHRYVTATSGRDLPAAFVARIEDRFRRHARRALAMAGELIDLLQAFDVAAIRAVPLKGPLLAERLYGDVAMRQFADLDLLVPPGDRCRATALLEARGYSRAASGRTSVVFRRESPGCLDVDLQWAIAEPRFSLALPDSFWRRLQCRTLWSTTIHEPSLEDTLLLLCSHPAKHCWSRIGWICDIAAFVRRYRDRVDWDAALAAARRGGTERLLLTGARLAADVTSVDLPAPFVRPVERNRVVQEVAADVARRLFEPVREPGRLTGSLGVAGAGLLYVRSRERPKDKVPYVRFLLALFGEWFDWTPNDRDRAVIELPPWLGFLYYAIRPARLTRKFGGRLVRRTAQLLLAWR